MKKRLMALVAFAAAVSGGAAHAQQGGFYVGGSLMRTDIKIDSPETDNFSPMVGSLVVGTQIDRNIAAELRYGMTLTDDKGKFTGVPAKVKVKDYMGVYAKGLYPLSSAASVYGLLGYTSGKAEANGTDGATGSSSSSDSSISFGLGGSFAISRANFVTVEWLRLWKGDNYSVKGLAVGFNHRF